MKLLIVTAAAQFQNNVFQLFREADIKSFSGSDIDGYKNTAAILKTSSWFPSESSGVESHLFFSFTEEEKIDLLMDLVKRFNKELETDNPIKLVVLSIEKYV